MSQANPFEPFTEGTVPTTEDMRNEVQRRAFRLWDNNVLRWGNPEVAAMVSPPQPMFDAFWTPGDEENLQKEWQESQEKSRLGRMVLEPRFFSLWKACLQLMRCSPVSIVSPRRGLQYLIARPSIPNSLPPSVWGRSFCQSLRMLVVHPIFQRNADILALVLQYYAIRKTNYRLLWHMKNPVSCAALDDFERTLSEPREPDLSRSYHSIHVQLRSAALARGAKVSLLSDLMIRIGEVAIPDSSIPWPVTSELGMPIFCLGNQDLVAIIGAIDTAGPMRAPILTTAKFALEVFQVAIQGETSGGTLSRQRVMEFYEKAWLHERRELRRSLAEARAFVELISSIAEGR